MRVLHVITGLQVGGAETMLHKLLVTMDRKQFDPFVVSLQSGGAIGDRLIDAGIPVHAVGMKPGLPTPAVLWRLRRLARDLAPDVVQGWMYHGNLAAAYVTAFAPADPRQFWNIRHSLYSLARERRLTRAVIRLGARLSSRPGRIIFNSTVSIDQHALLGYRHDRAQMIPNGFDLDHFQPDPSAREIIRAELGLEIDARLVGVVGRRHPLKGHDDFLEAAQRISARRPDVHFVLAGRGVTKTDPVFREALGRESLAGRLHLLGPRSDTPVLFAALDVLAMPSISEGFPNVVGEAMACGVPCAATDVGETAAVVGDAGKVVPPSDPAALATAVLELLDLDPDSRLTLAAACRDRIRREYSLARIAGLYEDLYASD